MPTSLVRFVRNFSPNELAPPVSCIVDEVTPGRFKLYAEFVSGEQALVVDVEPELDPSCAAYVRRKHYRCWPNGVANLKTSLIGEFYPTDVVGFLDAPGVVRVFSKHQNDWWFKAVIMLNDPFPADAPAERAPAESATAESAPASSTTAESLTASSATAESGTASSTTSESLTASSTTAESATASSATAESAPAETERQAQERECRKRKRRLQPASCMVY